MIVKKVGAGRNRVANVLKPVLMPNTVAEAVEAIAKVRQKKLIFTGINLLRGYLLLRSETCQYEEGENQFQYGNEQKRSNMIDTQEDQITKYPQINIKYD